MTRLGSIPPCRRIDRQFADRYLDSAHSPIADSQNLLGVRRQDQVDITRAGVEIGKRLLNSFGMIDREIHAPRTPAFIVVLLHRHAYGQPVDDGDHFTQML